MGPKSAQGSLTWKNQAQVHQMRKIIKLQLLRVQPHPMAACERASLLRTCAKCLHNKRMNSLVMTTNCFNGSQWPWTLTSNKHTRSNQCMLESKWIVVVILKKFPVQWPVNKVPQLSVAWRNKTQQSWCGKTLNYPGTVFSWWHVGRHLWIITSVLSFTHCPNHVWDQYSTSCPHTQWLPVDVRTDS